MEKSLLFQSKIDKHRFHGSHGKFMVTEKAGYIGTSNWAEDYFTDTAGKRECLLIGEEGKKHT